MQESRLFKIIYYLLDKEVVTAPELAEKFEVSIRTIYRDIDVISSAGVPIYTTQGRNGGIRLLDNYVLDKSLLSKTEKEEILIGLQSLSAVQYLDTNDVLTKLGGFFKTNPNWIEVDFTRWGSLKETEKDTFNILKRSIIEKYILTFTYYGASGNVKNRKVEPLKLIYRDKAWYVLAYCLERLEYRLFRVSRMKNVILLMEKFTRVCPKNYLSKMTPIDAKLLVDIVLEFELQVGYRLYDVLNENAITRLKDKYLVQMTVPKDEWLYNFIMSFGDKVKIVKPKDIKDEVIRRYQSVLQYYNKE